ncbi:MAG: hypothetical protein JRD68_15230 [Deltaproteobacteria bacterium]|nr:hypothetical protein [Deltaproteobacteria bacterium]
MADIIKTDKQVELCTIDGKLYMAVEDKDGNVKLAEKTATALVEISGVTHTADEMRDLKTQITAATPAARVIRDQVVTKIREQYSVADEIKMLRISPSPETAVWNDYVEGCRAWGRAEKAKLGL